MSSTKTIVIVAVLLISLASCAEDEHKLVERDITTEVEYAPNEDGKHVLVKRQRGPEAQDVAAESVVVARDGLHQDNHLRVKRNWPFSSSQHNARIVNDYYQRRPNDNFWVGYIQKPFARYVGRSFGDEFPAVRDSIIAHQNRGYSFSEAHQLNTGYHPDNWRQYNKYNDLQENRYPYNPWTRRR